ncbi:MAG: signal recognition particle protein [Bacteroidetes bacterium]|nr:signal recognition particle protein [Bacteroidota bacterium]
MFENLQSKLESAFKTLKGQGRISEINVAETVKEIRKALLDADVNYKIAKEFTDKVKEEALGQNVITSLQPGQLLVKIVNDQLTELLGGETTDINLTGSPNIILVAGLQGSGKTTFTGKLAFHLKTKRNQSVMLAACDVYRPAAIDQLKVLAEQVGVPVYTDYETKNPVAIAQAAVAEAKLKGIKTIIIDTAGRLSIDEQMMNEIYEVKQAIKPNEILFVVDSMTGQDAVNTAQAFNEKLNFDGVVLTKLDGDTRGGAALSIKSVVNKPIKFVGTGEKMEALDVFYPDRMAQRILGMGDIVSLVEKAQMVYDEEEANKLNKKIASNKFDFEDFYNQIQQIKKMGNLKDLMGMIPGIGKAVKEIDINDDAFKEIECIIQSMTPKERKNPEIINGSRRARIAKGCGKDIQKVNQLMKQFEEMKKMMKTVNKMQGAGRSMKLGFK